MVKYILHAEGAAVFAASLYALFGHLDTPWWVLPILVLGPDVSMVGYLSGPRVGAVLYNAAHTYVLTVPMAVLGWISDNDFALITGLILVGHIGMDRAMGFGLKYATAFKDTHLGRV